MEKKVYIEPDFSVELFRCEDCLSASDIGRPVPPISDGGTYD